MSGLPAPFTVELLAVRGDGTVFAAGPARPSSTSNTSQAAVVRYTGGAIDPAWADQGLGTSVALQAGERIEWLFAQPDGGVVLGIATAQGLELVRFTAEGARDTAFAGTGTLVLEGAGYSAAMQSDGRILVASSVAVGSEQQLQLSRFRADGFADTGFGARGSLLLDAPGAASTTAQAIALQADGRIVVGGYVLQQANGTVDIDALAVRLNANGSLDTGFGSGGYLLTESFDIAQSVAVRADGRIVLTGDAPDAVLQLSAAGRVETASVRAGGVNDDALRGTAANDILRGGDGTDTAFFSGTRAEHGVTRLADGTLAVTDTVAGRDGADLLQGVERLRFADGSGIAFDVDGHAGQAFRLYQAAFDRAPDLPGLGYQMNDLDVRYSLVQVAQNFIASPEFAATYGALDDTQFVTQLYANVLDRAPDAPGLAFHTANLAAGLSRAAVLVGFSESPENQANLAGAIAAGMAFTL